jgi:hypothetical protein
VISRDVSAISKTNVIAVGHSGAVGTSRALVERFDGTDWVRDDVPDTVEAGANLFGVSTPSATGQWAVAAGPTPQRCRPSPCGTPDPAGNW